MTGLFPSPWAHTPAPLSLRQEAQPYPTCSQPYPTLLLPRFLQVVEFSMRYFQALKAAGYERVLQLAAGAEPVALPEVATSMPTPLPADPDSMYTAGEIQPFFSAVAGVLLHGVRTIGGQLEAWGVQLVQAPLSPTPGSDPSQFLFGLEVIFPEELTATGTSSAGAAAASSAADGEVTSSRHRGGSGSGQDEHAGESEGHSGGVPASKAEQFIRDQLAPIVVMSDLLLHAVQKSQEVRQGAWTCISMRRV